MKSFEELHCWQKAKDLSVRLYADIKDRDDTFLKEQLALPCFTIATEIAMRHAQTMKENMLSLVRAKAACGHLRSMLYIVKELDYFDQQTFDDYYDETVNLSKMISGLIKSMKAPKGETSEPAN